MNVLIRKWLPEDATAISKAINNPAVLKTMRDGIPYPYSEEDGAAYIASMNNANPNDTFAFAITLNSEVVGSIGAFRQANIHSRTAEIGYYIGEEHWGKGIATEAVRQLCGFIFMHTDILRIYAEPFAYNVASCRVLEKAGFHFEGTLRANAVKNGKIIDMKLYALIKEDLRQ